MTRPRLFLACMLLLCACATPAPFPANAAAPAPSRPSASAVPGWTVPALPPVLEVHNDHGSPMTLFLVLPGHRYFLGEVDPGARGRFRLPTDLLGKGPVQVLAQARGRALEYITEPLSFDRGHNFEFGIRKNLFSSRIRIR